jgi:hypothetical protein
MAAERFLAVRKTAIATGLSSTSETLSNNLIQVVFIGFDFFNLSLHPWVSCQDHVVAALHRQGISTATAVEEPVVKIHSI